MRLHVLHDCAFALTESQFVPRSEHLDAADPENPLIFGNSIYSVKFDSRENESVYGHRYTFFLQDAVEEVPEYVVYWDNFVRCVVFLGSCCGPCPLGPRSCMR